MFAGKASGLIARKFCNDVCYLRKIFIIISVYLIYGVRIYIVIDKFSYIKNSCIILKKRQQSVSHFRASTNRVKDCAVSCKNKKGNYRDIECCWWGKVLRKMDLPVSQCTPRANSLAVVRIQSVYFVLFRR